MSSSEPVELYHSHSDVLVELGVIQNPDIRPVSYYSWLLIIQLHDMM